MEYKIGDKFKHKAGLGAFKSGEIVALRGDDYILTVDGHTDDTVDGAIEREFLVSRSGEDLSRFYDLVQPGFEVGKLYKNSVTETTFEVQRELSPIGYDSPQFLAVSLVNGVAQGYTILHGGRSKFFLEVQ